MQRGLRAPHPIGLPYKVSQFTSAQRSLSVHLNRCQRNRLPAASSESEASRDGDGAGRNQQPQQPAPRKYRGSRMTSEELRARLLRNAQRTDAAKAGA